ncbi:N-acetylmuramoyl-L-alanine amidase family protein [Paenibacillus turpanensis]|uniref:N-acetylmuramoyl-L-alanine amidase family protein n=1 Tax=Paenibacillus turpanensis TaxID=2689078 RepID=UPI00140D92A2|nr:N-acetylmuramoyl-L-alanine amidase [Paenibacillus turpanensis]
MRRKTRALTAAGAALLAFALGAGTVEAQAEHTQFALYVDGTKLSGGASAVMSGNTLYVPQNVLEKQWNLKASTDSKTNQITVRTPESGTSVSMTPLLKDGQNWLPLQQSAQLVNVKLIKDELTGAVFMFNSSGKSGGVGGQMVQEEAAVIHAVEPLGDSIRISSDRKPSEPVIQLESQPDRLIIDIPNAKPSTQAVTKKVNEVVAASAQQVLGLAVTELPAADGKPAGVRIVAQVNGPVAYKISQSSNGMETTIKLKPAETRFKIVIDPGHGGNDSGAVASSGNYEKDFNLTLSNKVKQLLDQDPAVQAEITRSTDVYIPLDDRVAAANGMDADLYVSIHANANDNKSISGTETYYNREESKALAEAIHTPLVQATGFKDRGVRFGNFKVIRETTMPAVLLEVGYMSNASENAVLRTEALQNRVAEAIAKAIADYIKKNH